jgi:L-alanine-DL-glutamate epimerase-like enolase superfamily enzyme
LESKESNQNASWLETPWTVDLPTDVRITRIVGFDLVSRRPKFVGKNSRLDDHGDTATDRTVRVFTTSGLEGLGYCAADESVLAGLLGTDPFAHFRNSGNGSPLAKGTMPLWDLAAKALGKPVYELLGGRGLEQVPAYDGSIYFADLIPEYADNWHDRFRYEIDLGRERGHTAFKVKIGRGAKWMPVEEGYARDKAVLAAIREHAGPEAVIGVDANNGYDLARTKRFLTETADLGLEFVEEMFPEDVSLNLGLNAFLLESGLKTLVCDGETQDSLEPLRPLMKAGAVDVYQADMRRFGIEGILTEAGWADEYGLKVAPHNWGSLVGYYMILHIARAIPNFYMAEHDPLDSDFLISEGYDLENGMATVPAAPGFGLALNEARFAAEVTPRFDIVV